MKRNHHHLLWLSESGLLHWAPTQNQAAQYMISVCARAQCAYNKRRLDVTVKIIKLMIRVFTSKHMQFLSLFCFVFAPAATAAAVNVIGNVRKLVMH